VSSLAALAPATLTPERINSFKGALRALGNDIVVHDERTMTIGGATFVFDDQTIIVDAGALAGPLAERIGVLSRIFRITVVDSNGERLAPAAATKRPMLKAVSLLQAKETIIDDIITTCSLVDRTTPTSGRIGIKNVDVAIDLSHNVVRLAFRSIPPADVRVLLGGGLIQITRVTDEIGLGTRVSLPTTAPEWLSRTFGLLGWHVEGTAGIAFSRPTHGRRRFARPAPEPEPDDPFGDE
jgi:hypothetical protein